MAASLYIKLDQRHVNRDGTSPLRMGLVHNRVTAYEALGMTVRPDEWNHEAQAVVKRLDKKLLNVELRKRLADAEEILERVKKRPDFACMKATEILRMCMRGSTTVDTPEELDYVLPAFNEKINMLQNTKNRMMYRTVKNNLVEYLGEDIDTLRFKDINAAWLMKYHNWLLNDKRMSINGANTYLRTFRALFNFGRANLLTLARVPLNNIDLSDIAMALSNKSPFQDIDMSTTESDRFDMPFKDFVKWVNLPVPDWCVQYRDLFLLAFFLCGIRPVDILHLKHDNVRDGRLVYYPKKLGGKTRLSIKIWPEAWEIIERYKGKDYLLNFLDHRSDYAQFCKSWNKGLKSVREPIPVETEEGVIMKEVCPVPYITAYYARYNWGTYCYNLLNIPMDVISQGYGHKNGVRVTNFYVKRDNERVDQANRQLIDYFVKAVEEDRKKNPYDLSQAVGNVQTNKI